MKFVNRDKSCDDVFIKSYKRHQIRREGPAKYRQCLTMQQSSMMKILKKILRISGVVYVQYIVHHLSQTIEIPGDRLKKICNLFQDTCRFSLVLSENYHFNTTCV